ncbi:MAG: bifunctional phosphoribosyl-AMP cyclohydrolase/phosphoribosyl-ATP diphosphatase HisIE [Planctomycetes bacterium]|nr:bifunctional phosphoribosyl-AMP cyclohydrolase/phosphoribosyl-ATP diphosphatase HisIE [Planctomycetota bacterium]MCW8134794.1 bifunctional phosphoribosyl-AMP cyclohydrolase/phosphoribosyl-ATP diphosphatase HisIE [Planctomycetota bacterium]
MSDFTEQAPVSGVRFDSAGLLPCVLQDARTGVVLTLAYMNAESFKQTLGTGLVTFYSRSRKQLWVKGETSGNTMRVAELKLDCDGDALVARVLPDGPACHTGEPDCFFQTVYKNKQVLAEVEAQPQPQGWGPRLGALLEDVRTQLQSRKASLPEGSYSTYLFSKGLDKILKKLGEEATETIVAAKGSDNEALAGELCDLLFHMLVLMVEKSVSLEDLRRVMEGRHRKDESAPPSEVKVGKPEGCHELEQRLLKQLDSAVHRDVQRALEVMYRAHKGQLRDGGGAYALHPLSVAIVCAEEVKLRSRDEIIAALLHDVLEDDMQTTPAELTEKFGVNVSSAVITLTKMYKRDGTPTELGLQRYYQGLRAAPGWVRAIKMCDRVHNLRTLESSGRAKAEIDKYRKETRANLLPLAASSMDQALLKAGDLLLKELYK